MERSKKVIEMEYGNKQNKNKLNKVLVQKQMERSKKVIEMEYGNAKAKVRYKKYFQKLYTK